MTRVRIALRAPAGAATDRHAVGQLEWSPTARRVVGGVTVLPAGFVVPLDGSADPTIDVAATAPGWAWRVVERMAGGSARPRHLTVPATDALVDYADLIEVDPATLQPTAPPAAAWWAALDQLAAQVADSGTGGAGAAAVAVDPDDPDALVLSGQAATVDPDDPDAVLLIGT